MEAWQYVESDFHRFFGVDLDDAAHSKSVRWFRVRLFGLTAYPDSAVTKWLQQQTANAADTDPDTIGTTDDPDLELFDE